MEFTRSISLKFLIYHSEDEPEKWVAHCLELDVVAVGSNRPRAILLLKELIDELFSNATQENTLEQVFTPAPIKYWRMLAKSRSYVPPENVKKHRIEAPLIKRVDYLEPVLTTA
jgi:hypothetical protein